MKNKTKYIDFHNHTIYSDGTDTPKTLVSAQKLLGLDIIAKTDHDNLEGYYETKEEGEKWGIMVIPGVEFSAGEYHLLGLNFNPESQKILDTIENSKQLQRENSKKRVGILADYGMPISIEKVEKNNPKARLGKMNILFTMIKDPECRKYLEINNPGFDKEQLRQFYLIGKGIAGSEQEMKDLERKVIINSIHEAGGLAIISHPAKDVENIEKELGEFREIGIDGLEVQPNFYSDYLPYIEYAKKYNLLITYGSDYHGPFLKRGLLGKGKNILSPQLEERLNLNYNKLGEASERKLDLVI